MSIVFSVLPGRVADYEGDLHESFPVEQRDKPGTGNVMSLKSAVLCANGLVETDKCILLLGTIFLSQK